MDVAPPTSLPTVTDRSPSEAAGQTEQSGSGRAGERVLDVDGVLGRVCGNRDLLREIVAVFDREYAERFAALRAALSAGNARELGRAAHAIKGAVSALGGRAASDAAARVEMMARNGDLSMAEQTLRAVDAEVCRFRRDLDAVVLNTD